MGGAGSMSSEEYIAHLKSEKKRAEVLLRDCVIALDRRDPVHAELQDQIAEFFGGLRTAPADDRFEAVINTMVEADKGESYVVTILHPGRPEGAKPWDEGKMEVFRSYNREYAERERREWAAFLNFIPPVNS